MTPNNQIAFAVRRALVMSAVAAVSVSALPVQAQDQDQDAGIETVTVTGSRIQRQDFEATSPVFTLDSDALADAGTPQVEQVLNQLPQLVPSITTTSNNPSNGGAAFADLRGLGAQRTLVLVDGVRLQPSTTSGIVDLNTVPAALIESIEIMTGGGSATYGSDAIGGVVNIKLRRDFEGVQLSAHTGQSAESDGRTTAASILMGGNFAEDRGNAVFMVSYDKRDEVFSAARDFSRVALNQNLQPFGSTSTPEGYYVDNSLNRPSQAAYDQVFGPGAVPNNSWIGFNADSSVFSRTGTVGFTGNRDDIGFNAADYTYNFAPVNYLQLPLVRRQIGGFGHYNMAESVQVYSRLTYSTYKASQELAATPIGAGVGSTIPVTNPFIPADLATLLASRTKCNDGLSSVANCTGTTSGGLVRQVVSGANDPFTFNKRTLEVGPRNGTNEYDVLQMVLGTRGDFNLGEHQWNWDVGGSWGRMERTETQTGNVSRSRLQSAYNATVANPDPLGCGGLNPFGAGAISPDCADAIGIRATNITVLRTSGVTGALTGPVFALPAGPLQVAVGAEYRRSVGEFRPDEFLSSGDVVGFNAGQPIDGEITVKEGFAEFSVPILSEITAVNYLGFDAGYRYSEYNLAGTVDTYMGGLEYKPMETLKFRGSFQHAIRAPSVFNLFRPQSEGFPQYLDPCWNGSTERSGANAAAVNGLCAAQGVGSDFPAGNRQVRALTGGNPLLAPEAADTMTFGLSWQPTALGENQMRVAVDWFRYELEDTIGTVGAASIVSRCFNEQGANPTFDPTNLWCSFFTRTPAGTVTDVAATDQNLGKLNIDGVDLQFDFRRPVGPGNITANMAVTKLIKWQQQEDPIAPLTDQEGTIGVVFGETFPEWKGVLRLGYGWNQFDFNWTARYIDGMQVVNPTAARTPATLGAATTVPSYTYHRFTAGWSPTESIELTLGLDNVFDKDPPIFTTDAAAGVQSNTEPSTYDVLGRRYFANFVYHF
jgi:iron complex outermembrane recepter protein